MYYVRKGETRGKMSLRGNVKGKTEGEVNEKEWEGHS